MGVLVTRNERGPFLERFLHFCFPVYSRSLHPGVAMSVSARCRGC